MALIEFNNFSFAYMNSDGTESEVKSLDNINLDYSSPGDHQKWANQSARENMFP